MPEGQNDGASTGPSIKSKKEIVMFHVLDHADVAFSGNLSQATQYVIEHSGKTLDDAIMSGIRILYTDAFHGLDEVRQAVLDSRLHEFWEPVEEREID
jgi:hypothetical protein